MRRRKKVMPLKESTFRKAYNRFFEDKKAENLSDETLKTYRLHIDNYLNCLAYWDMPTEVSDREDWNWWTHSLQEDEGKNDITIASYCRSVRAFLYWLQDNEYSPIYELKIPKYQKTIKVTYSDDELKIILECPKPCSSVEYQTWVFINLINATALRLSSALNIKVKDFVKNESCIYIQSTKNNKATPSYLNSQMVSILSKYILQFDLEEDNYLFCTANGNRMANRTMQDNVAAYNRSKNVEKTSIHLFRHTFSKNYYKKTKDIYTLSQILNHSSILVTEQYLRDLGVSIESAVAYNPQAQFGSIKKKSRRGIVK